MPVIHLPDGTPVEYPEGMDPQMAGRMVAKRFAGKHGLSPEAGEAPGWTGDLKSAGLSGLSAVFAGLPGAIRAGIGGDWNNPWLQRYRHETETIAPSFERASTQRMREEATKAIEKAEKEGGISSGVLEAVKQFGGSRLGVLSAVQSAPGMLAGAGIGGLLGRGATAALPSLAGRQAAISAAGAVGGESLMEGAEAANETYKAVFEEAIKRGLTPEEANRIADSAAKKSAAASAGVTATLGALPIPTAEKLLAGRLAGRVPGGRLSTAGLGALGEIPTEMAQAATSSIGTQRGLQELIPEEERTTEQLLKGVGGAMGQAVVGAGMIGGGAGFLSGGRRPEAPPPPAAEAPPGAEAPPVPPAEGGAVAPPTPPAPPGAGPAVPPPPAVVMTPQERQDQRTAYKDQLAQLAASGLPPETLAQIKNEIGGKLNNKTPSIANLEAVGEILKRYQPQGGTNAPGAAGTITGGSGVGVGVAGSPAGGTPSGEAGSSTSGALGGTNVPTEPPVGGEGTGQPPLAPEAIEGESPFPKINQTQLNRLLSVFNQPEGERVSDLDKYTFTDQKPGGSNPGGVYADKNGEEWLVKGNLQYQLGKVTPEESNDRANNEVLAAKLISLAGAGAPEMKVIDLKGKYAGGLGVASKMQTNLTNFDPNNSKHVEAAQKDYAIHAWLANYDVLGMGYDNTLIDKQGLAVNIDPGGAILFRAQGLPKDGMLDPTAPEFESMRNTTPEQKAVFGKISPEVLKESAQRLKNIDDSDISDLVDQYGPKDPAKKAELKKVLIARRDAILTKAWALASTKETKAPSKASEENKTQLIEKVKAAASEADKAAAEVKAKALLDEIDALTKGKPVIADELKALRKQITAAIEAGDADKFEELGGKYAKLFNEVLGVDINPNLTNASVAFPTSTLLENVILFDKDIGKVVEILKGAKSKFLNWIGTKAGSIPDLKIVNDQDLIKKNTAKGKVTNALYKPSDKSLHFNFVTFSGQSGIVGHELLHAIAQKSISYPNASQKPVVKSLKNLYEAVKDHPALQGEYGVKNLQEFVAEGFSNPEFQLVLSLIPYEGQSVWGKFTQLIANLIGVASNQRNAFIELVALTEQLTDLQATQAPKGQVTNKNLETAPPGKVIPPEQAKKNLQKWFGKTTHPYLADKYGNPKILYHGSGKEFSQFKPSGSWGGGIFTTENPDFALVFGGSSGQPLPSIKAAPSDKAFVKVGGWAKIYPVYVKAENPWDYENPAHVEALLEKIGELKKAKEGSWSESEKKVIKNALTKGSWSVIEDTWPQKAIKALGYDAFFMYEDYGGTSSKNIAVYNPTQIKSIFNSGVYNPADPELLKHEEDVDRVLKSESAAPAPVSPQAPAPKPKKPPTAKQQAFYAKKAAEKAEKKAAKEADAQRKAANLVAPSKSWIDDIRRKFQNVQIGLYKLSDAVKEKLGGVLPAALDLASALSLSKGEQAANFENYAGKLERRYVVAVKDFMKATKTNVGEATRQLSNYLLAKHELERRVAVYYEKRATLTDENEASRTFLRSAIVANDKELAKLKKDFKADIKTPEQRRVYDLVENSQDRAKDLYQEIINIVNNDPVAKNLDFNATTYDVVAYEGVNGEELKMTPEARDQIIADMENKFSNAEIRKAVEEAVKVQQGLDKAIQTMNKAGDYTPKGAARLMEARGWQNYVPQRGKQKEDSDFEYYGESGGSGLTQSESAFGGRGSLADNVITRSISEAKKAAGRAPGNRIATIIHNYVAEGYIKGKISKTPLTTLDNYVLGKNASRSDDIVLYRDPEGDIYEVKIDDPNIAAAIQAKTHDLIPAAEPFATATTLMAQTNTRFNPMFWLKNFFVDPLTNTFIIASEQGFTAARQYAGRVVSDLWDNKGTTKAMNFMRLYAKGELEQIGELAAKDAWYRDALEFVNIGGKVSYLSGLRNETQMDEMYKKLGPGKVVRTVEQLAAFVDPMTEGLELALRVSAFRTAKTFPEFQGDARKAAAYSKDLANFEQIGQWGKWMGAWFMFSRPSATGASRLYDALSKGKYAKQTVLTSAAFGSSVFFLSMLMGGDDDEGRNRAEHDDPSRWVRNWRLFIPGYESPVQIPWGFGFGSVGAASAQLSMFLFGKSTAKEFAGNMKTIASETAGLPVSQMSFLENPFAFMLDSITPTVAKPLLQMVANIDSLDRPVFSKGQSKYVSAYMGGENIPEGVKYISETMFDTFKEVLPQSVLKGLSADGLHFIANSYLGGVYRTINQMDSSLRATGIFTENEQKDINVVKATLLLSGFVGTAANYDIRKYYEVKDDIEQYKKVLRTYKDQAPEKYAEYKEEHPGRERAVKYFERQQNSVLRDLQEQRNKLRLRYKDSPKEREDALKENRERQDDVMRRMVERTRDLLEE